MIYTAIVFLPLLGALIAGLFGRVIGDKPSEIITTAFLAIAAVLSWVAFVQVGFEHQTHKVQLLRWITSGELDTSWSLRIDTLTAVMLVVVTTVSSLVHLYSIGYMHEDDSRPRFFALLSLFTFAMLMLVTADNLLQMFFGWEGVGLASYLLIGFWYKKPEANAAAIKAFVVNRVGDFGYALGIFALFFVFKTVSLDPIFAAVPGAVGKTFSFAGHDVDILTTIALLLFMGAMGKSAQFLLHTWLPDAMEGPTPVSALIHAATMVTAGVFMVARLSPVFEFAPDALTVVTFVGALTAFFAATVGLVQNDIKRVIAYSTCSQLGYMFVACGVGAYGAAIFHLFTHAFSIALLLFMGAMGKSAQFLLHTWLPDAMEGPTPVSALIHAATMVTAGVFMVARLSPVFEFAPDALTFVTFVGALTAFFAATVGLVQNDIKRVIAYSTCSQLGYMFVACGVGAYGAAIFHLFTHAFFKALLFLGAGSVIHAMHHEQDMRNMGGLRTKIPLTFAAMTIGTLALTGVGIPHFYGFAGFHSKDAIIEVAYAAATPSNYAFWTLVAAALMTSFYSWRLVFMTFFGATRADHETYEHAHESPPSMLVPLGLLALGAVLAGAVFTEYFIGHHEGAFWAQSLFKGEGNHILDEMHAVPEWVGFAPFVAMLTGFAIAWTYYIGAPWLPAATARAFKPLYLFLLNKWYIDELYDLIFVRPAFAIGRFLWKGGDGAVIDGAIDGTAAGVGRVTGRVVKLQTGYMYHYAFAMLIGVAALLTWLMYGGGLIGPGLISGGGVR